MLDYIRPISVEIFFVAWTLVAAYISISFYYRGRKAEKRFGDLQEQTVRFRERYVSGRSKKTLFTKIFGADKVLEVIVTDQELWIKGIWPMFTYLGAGYDLTHRVPLSQVRDLRVEGPKVFFRFPRESGTEAEFTLTLRDPEGFVRAVRALPY